MTPFLDLPGFQALWDGAPLTPRQQAQVTLWVKVASQWIYDNSPGISATDPTAQFVVYDVVSNAVRYQRYSKLTNFTKTTAHRADGGGFSNPMTALEFTDNHKQLLGLPLRAIPMTSCQPNDFNAMDMNQGWPTSWSDSFVNQGWDWWEPNND